jgi:hypothetical protein
MSRKGTALMIAAIVHEKQLDKGDQTYLDHPLTLYWRARDRGESAQIVAILHDTREDGPDNGIDMTQFDWSFLTDEEDQALDNLTRREGETYDEFITRCGSQRLSCLAKIDDITHNLDGARMPLHREITMKDRNRWEKYRLALIRLYRIKEQNGW